MTQSRVPSPRLVSKSRNGQVVYDMPRTPNSVLAVTGPTSQGLDCSWIKFTVLIIVLALILLLILCNGSSSPTDKPVDTLVNAARSAVGIPVEAVQESTGWCSKKKTMLHVAGITAAAAAYMYQDSSLHFRDSTSTFSSVIPWIAGLTGITAVSYLAQTFAGKDSPLKVLGKPWCWLRKLWSHQGQKKSDPNLSDTPRGNGSSPPRGNDHASPKDNGPSLRDNARSSPKDNDPSPPEDNDHSSPNDPYHSSLKGNDPLPPKDNGHSYLKGNSPSEQSNQDKPALASTAPASPLSTVESIQWNKFTPTHSNRFDPSRQTSIKNDARECWKASSSERGIIAICEPWVSWNCSTIVLGTVLVGSGVGTIGVIPKQYGGQRTNAWESGIDVYCCNGDIVRHYEHTAFDNDDLGVWQRKMPALEPGSKVRVILHDGKVIFENGLQSHQYTLTEGCGEVALVVGLLPTCAPEKCPRSTIKNLCATLEADPRPRNKPDLVPAAPASPSSSVSTPELIKWDMFIDPDDSNCDRYAPCINGPRITKPRCGNFYTRRAGPWVSRDGSAEGTVKIIDGRVLTIGVIAKGYCDWKGHMRSGGTEQQMYFHTGDIYKGGDGGRLVRRAAMPWLLPGSQVKVSLNAGEVTFESEGRITRKHKYALPLDEGWSDVALAVSFGAGKHEVELL